jgi:hypothetical protein
VFSAKSSLEPAFSVMSARDEKAFRREILTDQRAQFYVVVDDEYSIHINILIPGNEHPR